MQVAEREGVWVRSWPLGLLLNFSDCVHIHLTHTHACTPARTHARTHTYTRTHTRTHVLLFQDVSVEGVELSEREIERKLLEDKQLQYVTYEPPRQMKET